MKRRSSIPGVNFRPLSFFTFREAGHAVGSFTTHTDDILGRGVPDDLPEIRYYLEPRPGELKLGNRIGAGR